MDALERRENRIYHRFFLKSLQARLRRKARMFPGRVDLHRLATVRTLRGTTMSIPHPMQATGMPPTTTSEPAPAMCFVTSPCRRSFSHRKTTRSFPIARSRPPPWRPNPSIQLVAPQRGGHCGFMQRPQPLEDRFWVENRLVGFLAVTKASTERGNGEGVGSRISATCAF